MPIIVVKGDLLFHFAQTLVCPVNTVGAMGAGIAFAFKKHYPEMYEYYRKCCRNYYFSRHRNLVYTVSDTRKILCLPTKMHWRYPSKIEWIETALKDLVRNYEEYGITELAIPALGCRNGGLTWAEVRPLMYKYLEPLPIPVYLFAPE